jgi:hypothetical protein
MKYANNKFLMIKIIFTIFLNRMMIVFRDKNFIKIKKIILAMK